MKNCSLVMENYLLLDKGERIPLWITLHLFACKNCRQQVRLLKNAEAACAKTAAAQVNLNDESIATVMKRISSQNEQAQQNPISLSKWIVCGIMMLAFFLVFALLTKRMNSSTLKICTYIELTVLTTAYCSLFIHSNMDFFIKLINAKIPSASFQASRAG